MVLRVERRENVSDIEGFDGAEVEHVIHHRPIEAPVGGRVPRGFSPALTVVTSGHSATATS